jgi:hypothetical protein
MKKETEIEDVTKSILSPHSKASLERIFAYQRRFPKHERILLREINALFVKSAKSDSSYFEKYITNNIDYSIFKNAVTSFLKKGINNIEKPISDKNARLIDCIYKSYDLQNTVKLSIKNKSSLSEFFQHISIYVAGLPASELVPQYNNKSHISNLPRCVPQPKTPIEQVTQPDVTVTHPPNKKLDTQTDVTVTHPPNKKHDTQTDVTVIHPPNKKHDTQTDATLALTTNKKPVRKVANIITKATKRSRVEDDVALDTNSKKAKVYVDIPDKHKQKHKRKTTSKKARKRIIDEQRTSYSSQTDSPPEDEATTESRTEAPLVTHPDVSRNEEYVNIDEPDAEEVNVHEESEPIIDDNDIPTPKNFKSTDNDAMYPRRFKASPMREPLIRRELPDIVDFLKGVNFGLDVYHNNLIDKEPNISTIFRKNLKSDIALLDKQLSLPVNERTIPKGTYDKYQKLHKALTNKRYV